MILAGFGGGLLSGAACAPMELCMIQQQRFGTALLSTPGAVVRQAGVAGLYRGYLTSCMREGIFTAGTTHDKTLFKMIIHLVLMTGTAESLA